MRLLFIALVLGLSLLGQDVPRVELFGGYSYLRAGTISPVRLFGLDAANLNGWVAAGKINVTSRIGLLADFNGQYGERHVQLPAGSNPSIQPGPGEFQQHTFLFGPELCLLKTGRMAVHLKALAGAANRNTLAAPLSEAGHRRRR